MIFQGFCEMCEASGVEVWSTIDGLLTHVLTQIYSNKPTPN